MAGREVFVTNVECPDKATRKLSDDGIEEPFLTKAYLEPGVFLTRNLSEAQTATPAQVSQTRLA